MFEKETAGKLRAGTGILGARPMQDAESGKKVDRTIEEWRDILSREQFDVTRRHGTERAFSSPLHGEKRAGLYACICCGKPLFSSRAKFDSGTGWPSFFEPVGQDALSAHEDDSLFMRRTEIRCAACDAHLGHVFPDGPKPTGLRYCINGLALKFKPEPEGESE
jgi:peptide-methionine (R)-S-oxide reductase